MSLYSQVISFGTLFMAAAANNVADQSNSSQPILGDSLSSGSIGGISVGAAVGGALLVGGIYCCCRIFCGRGVAAASAAGAGAGLIANAAPV